ncbi:MAG: hypothetical protein ACYDBT_05705 [Desulfobulbaceae bacterium]|jgi:hypothetical protein
MVIRQMGIGQGIENESEDKQMEGIVFLVCWLGGAALHTLFDLKVKPAVQAVREESDFS